MTKQKKIAIALGLFSTGSLIGYILGRHNTPDATKPVTADIYLALYSQWKYLDTDHSQIELRAGSRIYDFRTGDSTVSISILSPEEMAKSPMPTRDYDGDLEKLVALSAAESGGYSLMTTIVEASGGEGAVGRFGAQERVLVAIGVMASGGLGYYFGHSVSPDVEEPKFQDELSHNIELWKNYDKHWKTAYQHAVLLAFIDLNKIIEAKPRMEIINFDWLGEASKICASSPSLAKATIRHPEICLQAMHDPLIADDPELSKIK
jgi:hypothetical protein